MRETETKVRTILAAPCPKDRIVRPLSLADVLEAESKLRDDYRTGTSLLDWTGGDIVKAVVLYRLICKLNAAEQRERRSWFGPGGRISRAWSWFYG